ncbi:eukaryotic translation initiation factor 3 subunit G [Cyclospora cayetanensis]|uniref:Eukaryotic translation initiation factor 3 subunit G n=1 Tax=Cyclospora cayetanensis TaxID=88456 RepID=A0A6P6RV40_9EIME|nr:eukaryotic translation initiation factor 3 subunit G [Cyclospora cayetanensis]
MTTDRKWADFELEDDGDLGDLAATPGGFETRPDSDGIKTVTNYIQNSKGETLKIIKRVKVTHVVHRINKAVHERRNIPFFGIEAIEGSNAKAFTVRSVEEIPLEVSKETLLRAKFKEDEDDEDIQFADLNPAKTSRDLRQKFLSLQNEDEPVDTAEADPLGSRLGVGAAKGFSRLRGGPGGDALKDLEARRREEATIRVTNLSEDAKEEDLTELFGTIGKLERVFLAKHKDKKASKGFAFITYANRELAAEAIRKLNRHGYDNLLLNVEWARPNNRER